MFTCKKVTILVALVAIVGVIAACAPPTPTEVTKEVVVTPTPTSVSPTATPICEEATYNFKKEGAFLVVPQDTQVCMQPPETNWQRMQGQGYADWMYGVGTFLGVGALVYLPGEEGQILMWPDTEIRLPDQAGGDLELFGGTTSVKWDKLVGNITGIVSGGEYIDPEFAVFEITYDATQETTGVRVYGGKITVSRPATGESWSLIPWQRTSFEPSAIPIIQNIIETPPPEIDEWLIQLELPTGSPRRLDFELEKDPTLDPISATDLASQRLLPQLMEGLFSVDPNGNIIPAGAKSFKVSEDGRVYTLYLREDAFWSDGVPVTAQHYVDGICRVGDPTFGAEQAYLLDFIAGFKEFNRGEIPDCGKVGIRAIDEHTLQIVLTEPLADLSNLLTTPLAYPVRLDIIKECGERWTEPACFVSNGAYALREWEHGHFLILEKNPYYWNAGSIEIDSLEFFILR